MRQRSAATHTIRRLAINRTNSDSDERWGRRSIQGELSSTSARSLALFEGNEGKRISAGRRTYEIKLGSESFALLFGNEDDGLFHLNIGLDADVLAWVWNELIGRPASILLLKFDLLGYATAGDEALYMRSPQKLESIQIAVIDEPRGDRISEEELEMLDDWSRVLDIMSRIR